MKFEPTAAPEGIANGAAGGVGTEEEWAMSTEASEGSADNATGAVCAVDVAQFFPSLSHAVMTRILERLGFSQTLIALIKSYFTGRVTSYKWDSAVSRKYDFSLGTPQGDCLSPILSALYISTAIRKIFPETMPPASTRCLFFVDDSALITASVKVTFGCTRVALEKRQPQDNLGLLSP